MGTHGWGVVEGELSMLDRVAVVLSQSSHCCLGTPEEFTVCSSLRVQRWLCRRFCVASGKPLLVLSLPPSLPPGAVVPSPPLLPSPSAATQQGVCGNEGTGYSGGGGGGTRQSQKARRSEERWSEKQGLRASAASFLVMMGVSVRAAGTRGIAV